MPLPASLGPTIDALLSSPTTCLKLGGEISNYWAAEAQRLLRAAYQTWFDVIVVGEAGKLHLELMDDAHAIFERDEKYFATVLAGNLEPSPFPVQWLERASFVDAQFPPLWTALEAGTIDAEPNSRGGAALRVTDGTLWHVRETGDTIVSAERTKPKILAWSLRGRLWDGTSPKTRDVAPSFRARVEQAFHRETILKSQRVELQLELPTGETPNYLLEGTNAYRYEDTGEEERSLDWTNPWPEPVFAFVPFSRDEVLKAVRAESTVVVSVDYSDTFRRKHPM